jgi:flagellar biosynthesis protein FliO
VKLRDWDSGDSGEIHSAMLQERPESAMPEMPSVSLHHQLPRFVDALLRLWRSVRVRRRPRALTLCETVSLGDKRYVAVVQFEQRRFLLGVTAQSVALLQALEDAPPPGAGANHAGNTEESF